MKKLSLLAVLFLLLLNGCKSSTQEDTSVSVEEGEKIVSLNGTITEVLYELGLKDQIVGVDITSVYPTDLMDVPRLGHISQIKAEGIIALSPDVVLAKKNEFDAQLKEQLEAADIKVVLLEQEYTADGTADFINAIAKAVQREDAAAPLIEKVKEEMAQIETIENPPLVLFIYARGAGNMMVAGENTQMQSIIRLAGGENTVSGFEDFKPLSTEVLVEANPDAILMFESGKRSLNGEEGILEIPGMLETTAGKNKNIIAMDGLYLSGFGPRLGAAAYELNQKLKALGGE